jgi:hypothetical protein
MMNWLKLLNSGDMSNDISACNLLCRVVIKFCDQTSDLRCSSLKSEVFIIAKFNGIKSFIKWIKSLKDEDPLCIKKRALSNKILTVFNLIKQILNIKYL